MEFRTSIDIKPSEYKIRYNEKILILGSCFSENIGNWLNDSYFETIVNPFGVIYNPLSVSSSLKKILSKKNYTEQDLFYHQGLYHCFDVPSRYSENGDESTLLKMNKSIDES